MPIAASNKLICIIASISVGFFPFLSCSLCSSTHCRDYSWCLIRFVVKIDSEVRSLSHQYLQYHTSDWLCILTKVCYIDISWSIILLLRRIPPYIIYSDIRVACLFMVYIKHSRIWSNTHLEIYIWSLECNDLWCFILDGHDAYQYM